MLSGLLLAAPPAVAAPQQPDSGQILRDTQQTERTIPKQSQAQVDIKEEVRPPLTDNTGQHVLVDKFRITGQNIVPIDQLEQLVATYTKKEQTLAGMQQAANAITRQLRSKGFPLAQAYIPAQDITGGIVEIAVLIGRVGEVTIKNSSTIHEQAIRQQLIAMQPGDYITQAKLERAALLANELSGVEAKMTLTPGKTTGLTNVILTVQQKGGKISGSTSLNNWGNRFTGSWQLNNTINFANLSQRGDNAFLALTTTGENLVSGNVNYQMPLWEGGKLNVGYSQMRYELGEEMADRQGTGTAYTTHADITYMVNRSRNTNLNMMIGYDKKRLDDQDRFDSSNKNSRVFSFGLSGDSNDTWGGGGIVAYSLTRYQGNLSGSSGVYTLPTGNWDKTTYSLMRMQNITDRLSLFLSLSGQKAGRNLDTSERFSLGGATGVRAYPLGEASGDEAWMLNSELRWLLPKKIGKGSIQLIAFYDTGTSHIEKDPVKPESNRRSLSGAGLGINYTVPSDYYLKIHYAWKTGSEAAKSDTDKSGRLWLQAVKLF